MSFQWDSGFTTQQSVFDHKEIRQASADSKKLKNLKKTEKMKVKKFVKRIGSEYEIGNNFEKMCISKSQITSKEGTTKNFNLWRKISKPRSKSYDLQSMI